MFPLVLTLVPARGAAPLGPYFAEDLGALDPQACAGDGCYTNYLRLTDLDGDSDLDLVLPNSGTAPEPLVVYLNDGAGAFTNASQTVVAGGLMGHVRQIAVGDVDGDGDPDLYAPDATGDPDTFLINDGAGVFADEYALRMPAGLGSHAAAARMGDVDGDADLDLLVGDRFSGGGNRVGHLYLNDGSGVFTDATNQLPSTTAGDVAYDFDLFDADGDLDLDLLIDMHSGTSMLWVNDGLGTYTEAPFPAQGALKYGPVACDVDADGDLDVWFDNAGPGYTEELLINDGTGQFTDETAARVTGNPGDDDNGLACIDVDGDGDFDAAIASLGAAERLLINDGTGRFALEDGAFTAANDSTLWFDFGDLDGDGRMDCATGQGESGGFEDRVYFGTDRVAVDVRAPLIRATGSTAAEVEEGVAPAVRFAVSDEATTDEGPRLQRAFARIDPSGAATEVDAAFVGGDLFQVALPAGSAGDTVVWQPCAVDRQGNEGCGPEASYAVVAGEPPTPTDTGTPPDTTPPTTTPEDSGSAPPPPNGDSDDGGCGCGSSGSGSAPGVGWGLLVGLLALRRRS